MGIRGRLDRSLLGSGGIPHQVDPVGIINSKRGEQI